MVKIKVDFSYTIKNIENSLAKLPRYNGYDILLFHRANLFDRLKYRGFNLILAGHMHGGQFRIPKGRGALPRTAHRYDCKQRYRQPYAFAEIV